MDTRRTVPVVASWAADATFVTSLPVSGSWRGYSSTIRPSYRPRSSASGSQTSATASPPGARGPRPRPRTAPAGPRAAALGPAALGPAPLRPASLRPVPRPEPSGRTALETSAREPDARASLLLHRERADRLHDRPVRGHRRLLGVVVRGRHLDHVHARQVDRGDDR